MKTGTCFLVLFVLLILTADINAQPYYYEWNPVNTPVQSNLTYFLVTPSYLFSYGYNGACIYSTNSGYNWSTTSLSTNADVNSVYYYNTSFVIACGSDGTVIKSTNSGFNWIAVSSPGNFNLNSITGFIGSTYSITCGDAGKLYYSTNQGAGWVAINSGSASNLRQVFFNTAYSNRRGLICGDNGTVLKIVTEFPPIPPVINIYTLNTGFNNNFYSCAYLPDTTHYLVCGSGGIILKSTNAGQNWFQQASGTSNSLRNIHVRTNNDIWICGDNGTVLHTTNGGLNWSQQIVHSQANLSSLTFSTSTRAFACGSGGTVLACEFPPSTMDTSVRFAQLDGNNISTYFYTSGIFNQNIYNPNTPGFEWPKSSGKYAIFTSGVCIAGMVNNNLREAMASYTGELRQGQIIGGAPVTPAVLNRVYKIKQGDNCYNSVDWANWGSLIKYGAPWVDVNNNGKYEPCLDTPGVRGASQTLFMALTDGFQSSHKVGEGFGGGTLPLFTDVKITAWCYTDSVVNNVQFIKYDIINRGPDAWNNTYFALVGDFDLGDANDDYLGSDSTRNMWYGYNGDNNDPVYGVAPPAVGMRFLKFPVNKHLNPCDTIRSTSLVHMLCNGCPPPYGPCETDPNGEPLGAYRMMKGYKKDGAPWLNPLYTPFRPVKFIYGGEPEPNTGWTEFKGRVVNCLDTIYAVVPFNEPGDRRFILGMGKETFSMLPGDSQTVVFAQMIARGTNYVNSVTKLKALSDSVVAYYNTKIFPVFSISGIVKYIDNNQPVSGGYVKALKLDKVNGSIVTLDSAVINPNGSYTLPNVPRDSTYIGVYPNSQGNPPDFVPGYYPSAVSWQQAVQLYPTGNLNNIDVSVYRVTGLVNSNSINGRIFKEGDGGLPTSIIYAKSGNNFVGYALSDYLGIYHVNSIPTGTIKVIVHRIGYSSDSASVNLSFMLDSVNFHLYPLYVSVKKNEYIMPSAYKLYQNYPNPFNPMTKIKFDLPQNIDVSDVNLSIYDLLGREVAVLVNDKLQSGSYEVVWNASALPSGVYICRLQAGLFSQSVKMVLLK